MTRFFIILVISLLPLRGWCADRMATDMAAGGMASHALSSGQDDSMLENCPTMIEAGASEAGVPAPVGEGERGCQACQLCMSLAPYEVTAVQAIFLESSAVNIPLAECFVSAERTRPVKPPIS